ncbi:aldo/keto reductase [Streptomyces sp. NPDC059679]|uniref:aldo/keto reductase n=1 Tax=Streptomyces sp. NPDC059679 TaxID=3346903 RepID=UPI0036A31077
MTRRASGGEAAAPTIRTLGRSGVPVTALSFGSAAIGHLFTPVGDEQAYATVDAAWDAGIRYFDTAPHYGAGLAERRLGRALRTRARDSYVLSTKVGRLLEPPEPGRDGRPVHRRVWDFSAAGVRRSIEDSLSRLGLDRVDIVYLHDPDDHAERAFREGYPELERLRGEGVIGAIGAGMNQAGMLTRFVRDTDVDAVLCAGRYTLLDQRADAALLPAARERGTSVVIGGVYNSGVLADPRPGAMYDYAAVPPDLLDRARRMRAVAERYGTTLRAAALAFSAAPDPVASVLVGARSPGEVADAAAQFRASVPGDFWRDLRAEGLLPQDVLTP